MQNRPRLPRFRKVIRCTYCGRELRQSSGASRENPRCQFCLEVRLRAGGSTMRVREWREEGDYLVPIRKN